MISAFETLFGTGCHGLIRAGHFAILVLLLALAPRAWADGEECRWPEPAQTLLKTNPTRLVSACHRLANQDEVTGQLNLGFLYEMGLGVPQNPAEAMRWWG